MWVVFAYVIVIIIAFIQKGIHILTGGAESMTQEIIFIFPFIVFSESAVAGTVFFTVRPPGGTAFFRGVMVTTAWAFSYL